MTIEKESDQSLLKIFMANPASEEGQAAVALLRYRQYLALKFYNRWVVVLTVVIAASTVMQAAAAWWQTPTVRAPHAASAAPPNKEPGLTAISEQLTRTNELLARAETALKCQGERHGAAAAPAKGSPASRRSGRR